MWQWCNTKSLFGKKDYIFWANKNQWEDRPCPLVPFYLCYFFLAQRGKKKNMGHLTGFSTSYCALWLELVPSRFTQLSDSSCNWLIINALLKLLLLLHLEVLFCITVRPGADCGSWRWRAMCFPQIWISRGFIFIVYFSFFLPQNAFFHSLFH